MCSRTNCRRETVGSQREVCSLPRSRFANEEESSKMKVSLHWPQQFIDFGCSAKALVAAMAFFALLQRTDAATLKTQNVFLIISDGFRWQEVFNGAEGQLISKENGGVSDTNALRGQFWRDTPDARREALLPFFWKQIASHGQLFGNQTKGSVINLANTRKFSYPGYNEILTGSADPRIDSNDKKL